MSRLPALTAVAPLLLLSTSYAGEVVLDWTPPTENTDGTPLTDLDAYRIYWGCGASGSYPNSVRLDDPTIVPPYTLTGLPDSGVCYFSSTAINAQGIESALSNEASKDFGAAPPLELPGPVQDLIVTAQESPPCSSCVDFRGNLSAYGEDVSSAFTVSPDGWSVRLTDNTWLISTQTFDVTSTTVVEFTYESNDEPELAGLGFDADTAYTNNRIFQVWGTQGQSGSFLPDFNDYTGGGPKRYVIPVGQFYTGANLRIVLVNDKDFGSGTESVFSDVVVR